jgi:hypothetical protein
MRKELKLWLIVVILGLGALGVLDPDMAARLEQAVAVTLPEGAVVYEVVQDQECPEGAAKRFVSWLSRCRPAP